MARLVGSDAKGGEGTSIVNRVGKPYRLAAGIIVIGQVPRNHLYPDTLQAIPTQEFLGHLGTSETAGGRNTQIMLKGALDLCLGIHGQDQGRENNNHRWVVEEGKHP